MTEKDVKEEENEISESMANMDVGEKAAYVVQKNS